MKSDPLEYKPILRKLLEKTRQRKVEWAQAYSGGFQCVLHGAPETFYFTISHGDRSGSRADVLILRMSDQSDTTIFDVSTNDLPTSPEEEEVSQMIEEIYDLARRQALKIELKLEQVSALLDQV